MAISNDLLAHKDRKIKKVVSCLNESLSELNKRKGEN
jgi:hypothetical protein